MEKHFELFVNGELVFYGDLSRLSEMKSRVEENHMGGAELFVFHGKKLKLYEVYDDAKNAWELHAEVDA